MLQISEIVDDKGLAALEGPWRSLLARAHGATPFQTWDWQMSWWSHQGRGRGRLWVLIATEKPGPADPSSGPPHSDDPEPRGDLVGILPLFISRYRGLPFRRVAFVGTPLSDYQDLIAAAPDQEACARAFVDHLRRNARRWDFLDLADLREGTPLTRLRDLLEETPSPRLTMQLFPHRVCPAIPLPTSFGELTARLGKNLRANLGRRKRQLAKAHALEFDTARSEHLQEALEALFRLHNGRWRKRGALGAFSSSGVQRFHHEVARRFLTQGWLKLHLLRLDGHIAAAFYCFQYDRRVYYYLSGFDTEQRRFSPGMVLMGHAVSQAISEGATAFDLLRGDENYKADWRAVEQKTLRLIIGQDAWRSRLALWVHRLERFIEHRGLRIQRWLWGRKSKQRAG